MVRAAAKPGEDAVGRSGRVYAGKSLFLFGARSTPRKQAISIVESPLFDPFILLVILGNCALMAWNSPLDPPGTQKAALIGTCEHVALAIFTAEMVVKVLSFGFVLGRGAYLRDPWSWLDFVVVMLGIVSFFVPWLGNFSIIRAARAMRPLRALKRVPGMPLLIESIIASFGQLLNVAILCALSFIVFGIFGVELLKGKLHWRCAAPGFDGVGDMDFPASDEFDSEEACNPDAPSCADGSRCVYFEEDPGADTVSFDSVLKASIWVMQAATFNDWTDPMYLSMNAYSPWVLVYFLPVVCVVGFFVFNLFLAVVYDEFKRGAEEEERKTAEQSEEDREAAEATTDSAEPLLVPAAADLSLCGRVARSEALNRVSTALVVLNLVLMCMPYADQPEEYERAIDQAETVISLLFIVEMALKLLGLGCSGYWSDKWNKLDGTIVLLTSVDLVLSATGTKVGVNVSFFRILRVARMFRLMRAWPALYQVCSALVGSLYQISNILILFLMMNVIFALLGMQLFGGKLPLDDGEVPRQHFDYFMPAMLTTFIAMTGEWNETFQACAEGGGFWAAMGYFTALLLVGFLVLANLFVAILAEAFSLDDDEEGGGGEEDKGGAVDEGGGEVEIGAPGSFALAGLLACDYQHSHSRLRTLRLNGNDLTLSGFHALGVGLDAARTNNGLRLAELDLAHTGLCVEGLRGLLGPDTRGAHLASLRRLDLRQNMLDDDGARLLGRGFRSLQGLSHLFLRGNEFGCEGAAALFVGFATWPTSEPPALQFCDALANHRLGVGAGRPAEGLAGCIDSVLAALSALPELTRLQLDPRLKRDDEAYNALQDACNRFDIDLHSF
mmetsp:Transcript_20744/g.67897  ORF Transcript_20744/g.67897 Transcript_20744/m.67897 type:complete len:841 (+) Transcript_20744:88-2610(+)